MRSLSEPFIRRPVMTALLTISVILFGVLAYRRLPVNDLPAVDYPVITVSVGYPGADPQTVANTVATPLERQFMQIPGLELITSKSSQGNCSLTLQFVLEKSVDAAATDVQAAITRAQGNLPTDLPSPPTFTKNNPNDQPILYVGVVSDSMTRGELYDLANTSIGQRISIVNGVSQVSVYGTKSAVRIKANPSALAARGLSMDDLANAIKAGTTYQGSGQFDGATRTYLLQPQGQLADANGYNNLIIGTQNNAPIYLKDVAQARDTVQDERIDMRFWVRGREVPKATVVIAVFRQAGSNAVAVADAVKALIPQIAPTLPASVAVLPIYDRSKTIVNSVDDVKFTLVLAFVLVVLVIYFFLGRATDTLIPAVALPLSLLLTFIGMNILGYSLDNLSLMALTLAIGFLVDDAIVFLENTVRRMEEGEKAMEAALHSAAEISFTIISMTISLAAVFLPLVFMSGLVGRIFREFAITIVIAIFASGIVSLTLTPLMCARMLGARGKDVKKTWLERVIGSFEHKVLDVYGRSLWFFLKHRWVSAITWVVCLLATGYLLYIIPKSFLPVGDSSFSWGFLVGQEGASPDQMRQYQTQAEEVMHANESIDMTFSMTGNGNFLSSNQGLLLAFLKDPGKRPPLVTQTPDGKTVTVKNPGIDIISQTIGGQIMGRLRGAIGIFTPQPVLQISTGATAKSAGQFAFALSGIKPEEVYGTAQKLQGKLMGEMAQGRMFASVISDMYQNTPSLRINILREKASLYGVSPTQIESLIRNAYSQNYVYLIKKADDQYQVILEAVDPARRNPDDLKLLYVKNTAGKLVPLPAVATWESVTGPLAVNHLNQFTSVTINFNLIPGVPIGNATDFIEKSFKEVASPAIRGDFQGEALTFKETISSLMILMVLAIFVMYVILGILYESYLHPITVLSSLPVALVGGLATLVLFGQEASLYAFVGMFMLMGIVKKNGIMIVDFAIQRQAHGQTAEQAIHDASMDRFRPIIMTTLAAVMGAIPIALGVGADGASRRPLGLVIVGGLVVSQFITLYVTPALYLYLEMFQEKVLNRYSFFRQTAISHDQPARAITADEEHAGTNGNGHAGIPAVGQPVYTPHD